MVHTVAGLMDYAARNRAAQTELFDLIEADPLLPQIMRQYRRKFLYQTLWRQWCGRAGRADTGFRALS
jgi:hypothetical protein